jgi:rSAM/selenodomain-associated transferase 2
VSNNHAPPKLTAMSTMHSHLAIIIPTLNEAHAIVQTLDHSLALEQLGVSVERCLVDGGSSDATLSQVNAWQANHPHLPIRCLTATPSRAGQMNAGVAGTAAPWLLFLHADTLLNGDAARELCLVMQRNAPAWGGFRHRFDEPTGGDWRLRMVSWLHNYRCQRTGTFYGDQAMFCHRALFDAVGGFALARMEDVLFSERLKVHMVGTLLPATITTSSRKFLQMGFWQSLARVIALQRAHANGRQPSKFAEAFFRAIR